MEFTRLLQIVFHFDRHGGSLAQEYGWLVYGLLFAVIFLEIGVLPLFFLPGDPLLFICGALCASGEISLWGTLPALFFAAVAGSLLNFHLARGLGHRLLAKPPRWLDPAALEKAHRFYERHGGLTFLLSPYVAVVRTFAPFVAGVSDMTPRRFTVVMISGAALWVLSLVLAGYFLGNIPLVRENMSLIILTGIGLGLGSLICGSLVRYLRRQP